MDRIFLRFITVMGSSIFSGGLALFMTLDAIALPSAFLTLVEGEVRIEDATRSSDGRSEEHESLLVQAVPAITPVTPQDVTPQTNPHREGVFPAPSTDTDFEEDVDDAKELNTPTESDVPEPNNPSVVIDGDIEDDEATGFESLDSVDPSAPEAAPDSHTDVDTDENSLDGDGETERIHTTEADGQTVEEPTETDDREIQAEEAGTDSSQDSDGEAPDPTEGDAHTEGDNPSDTPAESGEEKAGEDGEEEELTAEELERQQLLIEGDRLFLDGKFAEAEDRYRQAKDPFHDEGLFERPEGFSDPEQLSPAGAVYWREYQAGLEAGLDTRTRVPLALLRDQQPEFIPGHLAYAQLLTTEGDIDEALEVLEQATALHPDDPGLAMTRVETLAADEQWLQAAIASRQFALLEPDHPDAETFSTQADDYQGRFRRKMRRRLARTAIGNAIAGVAGFAVTGSWFGPLSALETTILMLQGESAVGARIANNARDELDMIEDEVVLDYVNDIGQDLAELGGRTEFEYEFYVVAEDELNAFALPGGKIFINAGAITRTETGAELAGLIAHELAHAILSHGFQQVTRGNLTANVLQVVPYGGLVTNLTVLRYSRDMERQADRLGTRLIATSPYAADGLHRLMQILLEESENRSRFDWLSTHPDTPERIRNLERLIEQNGYNRYSFEDIERHLRIQERVEEILIEMEKIDLDLEDEEELGPDENSTPSTSDDEATDIPAETPEDNNPDP